jgi:hypothetical protein
MNRISQTADRHAGELLAKSSLQGIIALNQLHLRLRLNMNS